MQVQSFEVRFMRRIQVREYEPAEAETKLSVALADGDDPVECVRTCSEMAALFTHEALGLAPNTKVKPAARGTVAKTAQQGGKATQHVEQPVQEPTTAAPKASTSDIPDAEPAKTAAPQPTAPTAPKASTSDIPDAEPAKAAASQPTAQVPTTAPAPSNIGKWLADQARSGKLTNEEIKSLYPKYNIKRIMELKPEQEAAFRADVEAIIARNSASDL